jgi:arylsulfatase A-like enzyme
MTRRHFLSAAAATAMQAQQTPSKPNILLILADDLGYGDTGCYGQKQIRTPNIDRLAADGVRFTQAYAGSTVCAPSRCSMMTGYHTGHARTRGNKFPDLPLRLEDLTFTEILKRSGYRTGLVGKWSLGGLGSTGYPTRKGFDDWLGFFNQSHAHNYYPEYLLDNDTVSVLRGNLGTQKKDYAHDLFTQRALQFLRVKESKPFFLKLAYTIPHANNEMGRDTGNGMEVPSTDDYADKTWPAPDKNFAAMVTRMDRDIGQLMRTLAETGQDQNTLVIFTSDNGPHREGGHDPDFFDSNGPLRGIKRDLYDGGIRVPFLARWPAAIRPGRVSDHVFAFWDMLPTVCELTGSPVPNGIDGISFAPSLLGRSGQQVHEYLYWEFHEGGFKQAVRIGDWKAVRPGPAAPTEIYNIKDDIGETRNLAGSQADLVRRAEGLFSTARTESPDWPTKA